jgi:hypothetical protein
MTVLTSYPLYEAPSPINFEYSLRDKLFLTWNPFDSVNVCFQVQIQMEKEWKTLRCCCDFIIKDF